MQRKRATMSLGAAIIGAALTWYALPFFMTCCGSRHPLDGTILGGIVFAASLPGLVGCLPLLLLRIDPFAAALISGAAIYGALARLLLRRRRPS